MKKHIVAFLLILFLVACSRSNEDMNTEDTFIGTVEELNQSMAIVLVEEGEILNSGDRVAVNISSSDETIEIGDVVRVGYEGGVMESYPLQINMTFIEKLE